MEKVYLVLMICIILLVSGCGKKDKEVNGVTTGVTKNNNEIVVTCSSWSGWSSDYEPIEETFVYPVQEGTIVKPDNKNMVGDFEFKIISATPNSITIKTNVNMSCKEVDDSGINLNSKENIFEIKKGEKIKLTSLTMDCGDIYIIEY